MSVEFLRALISGLVLMVLMHKLRFKINLLSFGCVLMVIAASFHGSTKNSGGEDVWMAMASGRHYVTERAELDSEHRNFQMKILEKFGVYISWDDPFSNKSRSHDENNIGWINQNWFSHVISYSLFSRWGGNSIVMLKFIQVVLIGMFMYCAARDLGAGQLISAIIVSAGILACRSYIDMRPNVTTMLFASITMFLLVKWAAGRVRYLLWMLPLMIIWCNIHGGFIIAIAILGIMLLSSLTCLVFQDFLRNCFRPTSLQWKYLFLSILISVCASALFSPYGLDNLKHPFLILGGTGRAWRTIAEWLPIYNTEGSGKAMPYLIIMALWFVVFIVWFAVKLRNNECKNKNTSYMINLGWFFIAFFTIYLAIKSRRFIFLSSVIIAPILAMLLQDVLSPLNGVFGRFFKKVKIPAIALPYGIACILFGVFFAAVNDIYARPCVLGYNYAGLYGSIGDEAVHKFKPQDHSVFWKMVGIYEHSVGPMRFINENAIKGTVMSEWHDAGYICYSQGFDSNGRQRLKVFMDVRAQTAYDEEHFEFWEYIHREDVVKGVHGDYANIIYECGINVVLLKINYPPSLTIFQSLMNSQLWDFVYFDGEWVIALDKRDLEEDKGVDGFVWNDLLAKEKTSVIKLCTNSLDSNKIAGIEKALLLPEYSVVTMQFVDAAVFNLKSKGALKKKLMNKVVNYLQSQYAIYKKAVGNDIRDGMLVNLRNLDDICLYLAEYTGESKYRQQAEMYHVKYKQMKLGFAKGGLLW